MPETIARVIYPNFCVGAITLIHSSTLNIYVDEMRHIDVDYYLVCDSFVLFYQLRYTDGHMFIFVLCLVMYFVLNHILFLRLSAKHL